MSKLGKKLIAAAHEAVAIDYSKPYAVNVGGFSTICCSTGASSPKAVEPASDDEMADDLRALAEEVEASDEPTAQLQRKLTLMLKLAAIKISELQRKIDDDY